MNFEVEPEVQAFQKEVEQFLQENRSPEAMDSQPEQLSQTVETPPKREAKRIPFGWLIERGLIEPGTVLFDARKKYTAKVRADGSLVADDQTGSIHKVAAGVQGAPACNGWTFWYLRHKGEDVPIDLFRQKLRAELN